MNTNDCLRGFCWVLTWWERQSLFTQNLTILIGVLLVYAIVFLIKRDLNLGSNDWIWHIAG